MKRLLQFLLVLAGLGYPFLVYYGLAHFSPIVFAVIALVIVAGRMLFLARNPQAQASLFIMGGVLILLFSLLLVDHELMVRLYPAAISLGLAVIFSWSLLNPPSVIERIARLHEPDLPPEAQIYTRKVTILWLGFFLFNLVVASLTAFFSSLEIWTLYNGLLSYGLIAAIFAGEFSVRQYLRRRKKW